jgi:hypothetical protein
VHGVDLSGDLRSADRCDPPGQAGTHCVFGAAERLDREFSAGAAAFVLCNPHNPVGQVHSPEELVALVALVALAHRYGVVVISDEIHAPLAFPGATFTPMLIVLGGPTPPSACSRRARPGTSQPSSVPPS